MSFAEKKKYGSMEAAFEAGKERGRLEGKVRGLWEPIAEESLEIEDIKGTFYAFGSELATLRLLKTYRHTDSAAAGYSKNLKKFYFRLENATIASIGGSWEVV